MKKAVVFGSIVMDVLVKSSSFTVMKSHEVTGGVALCEVYGGKTNVEEMKMVSGGGASNVAVALRKLGILARVTGVIGDDVIGKQMIDEIESYGVNTELVEQYGGTTGMSVILIARDGGRSIMSYKPSLIHKTVDYRKYTNADMWVVTGSVDERIEIDSLINTAQELGIKIYWNLGKKEIHEPKTTLSMMKKISLCCLNKMEACILLNLDMNTVSLKDVAKKMFDLGIQSVVITNGSEGACVISDNKYLEMKSFKVTSIDDTGAGDAFFAAMIAGMEQNKNMEQCLAMGIINGVSTIKSLGAKAGLLNEKQLIKKMNRKMEFYEECW